MNLIKTLFVLWTQNRKAGPSPFSVALKKEEVRVALFFVSSHLTASFKNKGKEGS